MKGRFSGKSLLEILEGQFPFKDSAYWKSVCAKGLFEVDGLKVKFNQQLRTHHKLTRIAHGTTEPMINPLLQVLYDDSDLVILDKPAPLPVHPCGRFFKHTLSKLAEEAWPEIHMHPVHRLDADTTGILITAKHRKAARYIHDQFVDKKINKSYLAKVHGVPTSRAFIVDLAISKMPNGKRKTNDSGCAAVTEFSVLADCGDNTAIIEARHACPKGLL